MTPHQADVAFVLESVGGVRALYAIDPSRRAGTHFDFALELEPSGRTLAEVQYALLRVMTHDDCARVFFFDVTAPTVISEGARLLQLTPSERDAARQRVPPPPPRPAIVARPVAPALDPAVLIVDDDQEVEAVVREVVEPPARWVIARTVAAALKVVAERPFDLILCDARRAFGLDGLLAKLPLDVASRVFVLARPADSADARWRLQGTERILSKPLEGWLLRERLTRAAAVNLLWAPDLARVTDASRARRRLTTPAPSAPFTALLADVGDDVHDALRRVFREEARHLLRHDPGDAAEVALSTPFHVILCSAWAALHSRSLLDGIAREDPAGADRVIVVALAIDVPYTRQKLARMGRLNPVLALPVNDAMLQREVLRQHPELVARAAVADVGDAEIAKIAPPRFRRLAVLVIDDDRTTEILFAAAAPSAEADVTLATTPMDAFEHVVSRPVDLLIVSATLRGDGGEPFYRMLWRLKPELKGSCVLVTPRDALPASVAPPSSPRRVVERPLTADAIARAIEAFARR